jgi:hypothetical protein
MKQATVYAKKLKHFVGKLRREHGKPDTPAPTDPCAQMLLGIVQSGAGLKNAESAMWAINERMVDFNELRVSPQYEIVELISPHVPDAAIKAEIAIKALNKIYDSQHVVNLECLKSMSKRDAQAFLKKLGKLSPHTHASIMLLSLQMHAVPIDDEILSVLKSNELVHPDADIDDVHSFLERQIPASESMTVYQLLRRAVGSGKRPAKKTKASSKKAKTTTKKKAAKTTRKESAARKKAPARRKS